MIPCFFEQTCSKLKMESTGSLLRISAKSSSENRHVLIVDERHLPVLCDWESTQFTIHGELHAVKCTIIFVTVTITILNFRGIIKF